MNNVETRTAHVAEFLNANLVNRVGGAKVANTIESVEGFIVKAAGDYGVVLPNLAGKPEEKLQAIEGLLEAQVHRLGLEYKRFVAPVEPQAPKLGETDPNFVKGLFAKLESLGNRLDVIEDLLEKLPRRLSRAKAAKKPAKRSTRR